MRVSQVYILLLTSAIVTMGASPGKGQVMETTTVDLGFLNQPLRQVFDEIEKQTDFMFLSAPEKINGYTQVNLPKGTYTVKEALDRVLAGTGLKFQAKKNYILVFPEEEAMDEKAAVTVNVLVPITGTVKDAATQEPLPGVNIIVKGTTKGTTTDAEGKFGIDAEQNDVLVFSFIGFKVFETQVSGRSVIDVVMEGDVKSLEEVEVNAGYWKVKQKEQTGNISRITSTEIQKQPVANPLQALQGRMPGVYIQQESGVPGGNFKIQIRGQNSLRAGGTTGLDGNLPLYIIDGVPFTSTSINSPIGGSIIGSSNPLNSLNPFDIESIEILKDADATAIYGSRGANGVVLVTTKKGKADKTKVDISFYQGIGETSNKMHLLNTQEYLQMRREAFINDGRNPGASDHDLNGNWTDTTRFTDWQEELLSGTAKVTNAQSTVSGGNQQTQFLVGVGYYRESTVFPGDFDYDKFSTNFNINHISNNKKLSINLSGNYVVQNNNLPRIDLTSIALTLPPVAPVLYSEGGSLNWTNGTFNNPLAELKRKFNSITNNLIGNAVVSYKIFDGLQIKTNLGYTDTQINEQSKVTLASLNPFGSLKTGSTSFGDNHINSWVIEPQLDYEKTLGKGRLNILVGSTLQKNTLSTERITGQGYTSDALLDNLKAAPITSIDDISNTEYKYKAFFGRINYNWNEKYFVNITGRRDGSSRFGPGRQFGNFGAIGAAWIFSEEEFIKNNLSFLSSGKLRMSYGTTGNDQIQDYGFIGLWNPLGSPYDGIIGIAPGNLFNPAFGWEISRKFETGGEFGFNEDHLFLSISYYHNRSDNQLVGVPLPSTTGFGSVQANFPAEVKNTGLELELNFLNIKTESFSWSTAINITIPRSELIAFPDIKNSSFSNDYKVGKSLGAKFAFHYNGVDTTGLYAFEDLSEDGLIRLSDDGQFHKEASKEYFGGFQNTLSYKGIQLDLFFQFVRQTAFNYLSFFGNPGGFSNQPIIVMNRWRQPGDDTNIQRFTQTGSARTAYSNVQKSDYAIDDASFIRLKNVSLSYQFPSSFRNKLRVENLRIYVQGQNLLTITNYEGLDPETQRFRLPPLKMLTLGAQITF